MEVVLSPGRETGQAKQSRELTQQFPEVWAEDNPPTPLPPGLQNKSQC